MIKMRRALLKVRKIIGKITGIHFGRHKYVRPTFKFIKQIMGNKELTGIEIGTFKGENAKEILKHMNIKRLYLIDPYKKYDEYSKEWQNSEDLNKIKLDVKEKMSKFGNKAVMICIVTSAGLLDRF